MGKLKKSLVFLIMVLLAGAVALGGCGGSDSASSGGGGEPAKTYELSLAHFFPATHLVETVLVKGWIDAVDKATDGQVKITSYPAGTLLPGPETYEGVVKGVADMGISAYAYSRGRFPVVEAFILPGFGYNNSSSASYAIDDGLKSLNPKEIQDVKYFYSFSTGPGRLMMDRPVRKMSDIRGIEIGVTSGPVLEAVKALGATGVNIPMPQLYENLQAGTVKGAVFPIEALQGFRLSDVSGDYITDVPFLMSQMFFAVMNKEKFNSLPADIQKKIEDATEKFYKEKVPGLFDEIHRLGWEFHKKQKRSVEVIKLDPAEEAKWIESMKPIIEAYKKSLNDKGLDGEKIVQTVADMVDKYNKQFPEKFSW